MSWTTGVVPSTYPATGPVAAHVDEFAANGFTAGGSLFGSGGFGGTYVDLSWRWHHHDAKLVVPHNNAHVDRYGTRFDTQSWTREIGGGDGPNDPFIYWPGTDADMIDVRGCPIFTVVVAFASFGLIDNTGQPINLGPIPVNPLNPNSPPYTPYIAPQPILAYAYTTDSTVFALTQYGNVQWASDGSNWHGTATPSLRLTFGGNNGGHVVSLVCMDPVLSTAGAALIEFDYTDPAHPNVSWSMSQDFTAENTVPIGTLTNVLSLATPPSHKGWSGSEQAGGGNIGAYFWNFFVHINGYIEAMAIIAKDIPTTVSLLDATGALPGTGPVQQKLSFRAGGDISAGAVGSLTDYSAWWPLDDARPGPMLDLVRGSVLSVQSPSLATFRVDGAVDQDGHSKGIDLGGTGATTTRTNLLRPTTGVGASSPTADFGVGGAGHDFTVSCLVKWKGPPIPNNSDQAQIFTSSQRPFGFGAVIAIQGYIGPSYSEPFGVTFTVWDSTANLFRTVSTSGFDWPADYAFDATSRHKLKVPVWAAVTFVHRTNVGGTNVALEIWVDGVLEATTNIGTNGWGGNVWLNQVGANLAAILQNFVLWPRALTPQEISGIAS